MNAGFDRHFPKEVWEEYALGIRSKKDCQSLEEHLLVCSSCQDLLVEVDEYLRLAKAEIRSHIEKLATIYDRQQQELLRNAPGDEVATRACISQIVSHYKAVCAVQDLEISIPELLNERIRFWFHISRLTLAWLLRVTNILPDVRRGLVARSVLSLSVLAPRLLDAL